MIHITRLPQPALLNSPPIRKEQAKIISFYQGAYLSEQKRFQFNNQLLNRVKPDLISQAEGKCSYCEAKISVISYGVIEHFRPKYVYPWLVYEWENLMYSCEVCNRYKADRFPIRGHKIQKELLSVSDLNQFEEPLLLNPYIDFPEDHLGYRIDDGLKKITIFHYSERGNATIETLALNRDELCYERYKVLQILNTYLRAYHSLSGSSSKDEVIQVIQAMVSSTNAYSGMLRWFFTQWVADNHEREQIVKDFYQLPQEVEVGITPTPKLMKRLTEREPDQSGKLQLDRILLQKIKIVNFKSIDDLEIEIYDTTLDIVNTPVNKVGERTNETESHGVTNEKWLLILGENGVGKSSILQAISLALQDEAYRKRYPIDPKTYLKVGQESGFIEIELRNRPDRIRIDYDQHTWQSNLESHNEFVLGYGSTRLFPLNAIQPEKDNKRIKIRNLFDYSISLIDGKRWLLTLSDTEFDKAALLLKTFIDFVGDYRLVRDRSTVFFQQRESRFELDALSDGYKSIFALVIDIYMTLSTQLDDKRYDYVQDIAEGVVLVDEIGTHLHPQWKMRIVSQLRQAFPKLNFVVTTHDPLCLTGLKQGEVMVLRHDSMGHTYSMDDLPDPAGMRADQLLTSEYFGLESTVNDPVINQSFKRYYQLLAKPALTEAEQQEKSNLYETIKKHTHLGENIREELFYYIIDEQLARNQQQDLVINREDLKQSVLNTVQQFIYHNLL